MHTMGIDPHNNGRNLSRITISGGKRAEPRLMMAHRTRRQQVTDLLTWRASDAWNNPPVWKLAVFVIAIVVIIALAGASR
jgi:anti-sigma-K factor RskA